MTLNDYCKLNNKEHLLQEWNHLRNGNITPKDISWGSNKNFSWKCLVCGYEWSARLADRTRGNTGCPACAGKVLISGVNDLASQFPQIAKEWHPTKNESLLPSHVRANTLKKVWWQCSLGHDFLQSINLRTKRNHKCPYCSNQKVMPGYNDLHSKYPEIAKEWHPTKNATLSPQNVSAGSKQKVWWVCPNGHEYEQAITKRVSRNQGCPYCSGHKALAGINDFETKFPEISKEWHPTKNGVLTPSEVTYGSGKKVWWICPIGHEYQAVIRDRGIGRTQCPVCNTRNTTSFPEQAIFYYVKQFYADAINKYSEIFDTSMELDIYIPSLQIAIEYDGSAWHNTQEHHQRERKKYNVCQTNGIFLVRVKECCPKNWNDVADEVFYLSKVKRHNLRELEKAIEWLLRFLNVSGRADVNLNRDKYEILRYVYRIDNSLADKRPDVAAKWNFKRNDYLKPEMFSVSSNEIVWWTCPECGNEWQCSINSMTRKGRWGCLECSKKIRGKTFTQGIVAKIGSLAENMPELAQEWHPEKNGTLTPNDISAGRFKPVWWLCSKCGYEWLASPNNRKKGVGCPCCYGRVPQIGVNDLETTHPDIAEEWDYEKNGELRPNLVKPGSGRKVWWRCKVCGNEYLDVIRKRTSRKNKNSCPNCKSKI